MGIFGKGNSGGLMNVIRCDEEEYLVWKWHPLGHDVNSTSRENSIRFGSSLRVKDGEMAVFVYKQPSGTMQDFIMGPYDGFIRTANLPVLSSIIGLAYGGESSFQADIYFFNLADVIKIKFAVPYFDVFDPRFLDFGVPVAVGGTLTIRLGDPKKFIKAHRLINFTTEQLKQQIKDAVARRIKNEVSNAPQRYGLPVIQIERKIDEINDIVKPRIQEDLEDFAIELRRLDISRIEIDKTSEGYSELRHITVEQQKATITAQTAVNIKNMSDMQEINSRNLDQSLEIQRQEMQRAQRLQTETQFIGAHALDRQSDVMQTAAENLGGGSFGGGSGSSGINPAQFMTGMAVGGALGGQMAGMVNSMGTQMNNQWQQTAAMQGATPPPMPGTQPNVSFYVAANGQQFGPYDMTTMSQLANNGQITLQTMVWANGMADWTPAGLVPILASLFQPAPGSMPPPTAGSPVPPPIP